MRSMHASILVRFGSPGLVALGLAVVLSVASPGWGPPVFAQAPETASPATPDAPPSLEVDLAGAVARALADHPALAAEEAAVRGAAAVTAERRAGWWPTVAVGADASRTTQPVAVFGGLLSQERFGPENFAVDFLNQPDPLSNWRTRLTVEQPLWTGGRLAAGVRSAEAGLAAAQAARDDVRLAVAHRVAERWSAALVAQQAVAATRATLAGARRNVELTRDLYEGGLVVESDLLQARLRESEAEAAVARAVADRRIAAAALALEMGLPTSTPVRATGSLDAVMERSTHGDPHAGVQGPEKLLQRALERRPDLVAARSAETAAAEAVAAARADRLPRLGVSGSFEANAPEPFDSPGTSWSAGVGLTWTLFDGGARRARIDQARAAEDRASQQLRAARLGAGLAVEAARADLDAARARREQARSAVNLAQRSLVIVRDRYREGLTTVVELLDAEAALARARTGDLAARRGLFLAATALDRAVGAMPAGVEAELGIEAEPRVATAPDAADTGRDTP